MMRQWFTVCICLVCAACQQYEEREREIGYKGEAMTNHFLAMERFVTAYANTPIEVQRAWVDLSEEHAMLILPADQVATQTTAARIGNWVENGGHVVILLDHFHGNAKNANASIATGELPEEMMKLMRDAGVSHTRISSKTFEKYRAEGKSYEMEMTTTHAMTVADDPRPRAIRSVSYGDGTMTFVADANFLKNEKIDLKDHAGILAYWLDACREGKILFLRSVEISFWGLLWRDAWMVLIALAALVIFWLLRHMPRFGPIKIMEEETTMRNYEHHLEMTGDFHWRTSKCLTLLDPFRSELTELCQHWQHNHGYRDEGLFETMARHSGVPFDRVQRAMSERKPADSMIFSRSVADLQTIKKAFT